MIKRIINIGDKFDRLTVIEDTGKRSAGREAIYLCKCDCGNEIEVRSSNIGRHTKSCGCIRKILYPNGTYLPALKINKEPQSNNTSGHVGVIKSRGKWVAQIKIYGQKIYLGSFDTYEEACNAREAAELEIFAPIINASKAL